MLKSDIRLALRAEGRPRRLLTALIVPVLSGMLFAAGAAGDDVSNDIDATIDASAETISLSPGGPVGTTTLYIQPRNGDLKEGCNIQSTDEDLVLGISTSDSSVATVAPSQVSFNNCGDVRTLTVTPLAQGTATISASLLSNTAKESFNLDPVTFTVEVEPAPVEPPTPKIVVAAPPLVGPPPPVLGQTVNVEPAGGLVRTRCPGDDGFDPLISFEQILISCLIDARQGTVDLTTATTGPDTQSGLFWGGVFTVSQQAAKAWTTDLKLAGPRRCEKRKGKRKGASSSARRRGGRGLWGSGKGNFRTSGNYGSASVRGTTWLVRDRCDNSTLFVANEGIVLVRDFVKKKSIVLRAGQSYVAKAAIARLR